MAPTTTRGLRVLLRSHSPVRVRHVGLHENPDGNRHHVVRERERRRHRPSDCLSEAAVICNHAISIFRHNLSREEGKCLGKKKCYSYRVVTWEEWNWSVWRWSAADNRWSPCSFTTLRKYAVRMKREGGKKEVLQQCVKLTGRRNE